MIVTMGISGWCTSSMVNKIMVLKCQFGEQHLVGSLFDIEISWLLFIYSSAFRHLFWMTKISDTLRSTIPLEWTILANRAVGLSWRVVRHGRSHLIPGHYPNYLSKVWDSAELLLLLLITVRWQLGIMRENPGLNNTLLNSDVGRTDQHTIIGLFSF